MIGIKTFLENICSFLNRRGILKKCYRCCAILTAGTTIIAVASLCNKEFGGKNNVTASVVQSDEERGETDEEDESEKPEAEQVQAEEAQSQEAPQPEQTATTEAEQAAEAEQAQLENRAVETVAQENMNEAISVSAEEYEILTRIVEAEAGTEDVKGKMLVANVILNRVEYEEFPDNIKDVVFQRRGKRYQFSPIKDGRYYEVEVQDSTRIAVDRVLAGEDESMGALFFCERAKSSSSNMKWFDSELELLFSYGCHEFFVYAR